MNPADDRRGEAVAALGALVALAGFAVLALLSVTHGSLAAFASAWHLLAGTGIWLLILVQIHQQRLLEQERRELMELERDRRERLGGAGSIFKEEDLAQMDALAMGRRLRALERWFVPIFAMLTAAFLAYMGLRCLPAPWPLIFVTDSARAPLRNASLLAFFAGGTAFICFALSRYALGMSRTPGAQAWASLRAGGAYFFGVAAVQLVVAVALVLAHNGYEWPERRVAQAIAAFMIVLALEIVLNFILDLYRPRVAGEVQRAFFESRLLGVFSEPEGILRSAAHTIDYQFGFNVSETWFYQLLGQAVVPLLLFQAAVIYFMTCFVVVPQGHAGVVEVLSLGSTRRWVARPGISLSWPWPLARTTLIPVQRVQRMELGYEPTQKELEEAQSPAARTRPVLWTEMHRAKEYKLLVADRHASAAASVPVNLLSVAMQVHWRVKPDRVLEFHRQAADAPGLIESLAYRELTQYAAHADLEDLMGRGGIDAAAALQAALQARCERSGIGAGDLGVEIVHVGLASVHPPVEVADAYENVINALAQKDTKIKRGEAEAAKTRMTAAGESFDELYAAIAAEEASPLPASGADRLGAAKVEELLRTRSGGDVREMTEEATARLYSQVTLTEAEAERFKVQRRLYETSPPVYRLRAYLRTLVRGLEHLRKYVVMVDDPDRIWYRLDLKPPPPLEVLSQEVEKFQASGGK